MKIAQQKICQSCGMPMQREVDFGTNHNGSYNEEFCKFCYQEGEFYDAGITLQEKIDKNVKMAVNMGMPEEKAIEMANRVLPELSRWK